MHTDNLTSKGIKEILVYSASHHAAWQIINNFKSILWYKYSQGPGRWPSTSHISPFHNIPSSSDFKERVWQDHCWQRVACNNEVGCPPCSSQEKCKRVTEIPLSADTAPTFSLGGDRVIQSVRRYFPTSWPDHSETPDVEATICHSQQKRGAEHK